MRLFFLRLILRLGFRNIGIVYNCEWPDGILIPKQSQGKHMWVGYNKVGKGIIDVGLGA